MWITKKENGKFKYTERYRDIDGKQKYVSVTLKSQSPQAVKQASKLISDKINEKLSVLPSNTSDYTFKEVTQHWLDIKVKTIKASTTVGYKNIVDLINEHIGGYKIEELTSGIINRMFLTMFNSGLSYKTVSERYKLVKNIIKFAVEYDYLSDDKITNKLKLEKMNLSEKTEDKFLEVEEAEQLFERMIDADEEELADLFRLQMQTGMRFGEIISLHLQDIDLINSIISIKYTYDAANDILTLPKGNRTRMIHINDESLNLIKKIMRRRKLLLLAYGIRNTSLLFFSKSGKPINYGYASKRLHQFETQDKPLTTHIFRHTFVTRMVEQNIPSKLIADHVGHTDTKLVDNVYSHFTSKMDADLKEAINRVKI